MAWFRGHEDVERPAPTLVGCEEFVRTRLSPVELAGRAGNFARLAAWTAARVSQRGHYYIANAYRGQLLYVLVVHHRPTTILEIGTGRGYSTLAMAMALADAGIAGRVYTLDLIAPDVPQPWPVIEDGAGSTRRRILREVWGRFPAAWTERITCITGGSVGAMREVISDPGIPPVTFGYIDGGHSRWTVAHDFIATLAAGRGAPVDILMDDYGGRQGGGVKRFVDEEVVPRAAHESLVWLNMPCCSEEVAEAGSHVMLWLDGARTPATPAWFAGDRTPSEVLEDARHRAVAEGRRLARRASMRRWVPSALVGRSR